MTKIVVQGPETPRASRLRDFIHEYHIQVSDISCAGALQVWVGPDNPPSGCHIWFRDHAGKSFWEEARCANQQREAFKLHAVAVYHTSENPVLLPCYFIVEGVGTVKTFSHEVDIMRHIVDRGLGHEGGF